MMMIIMSMNIDLRMHSYHYSIIITCNNTIFNIMGFKPGPQTSVKLRGVWAGVPLCDKAEGPKKALRNS